MRVIRKYPRKKYNKRNHKLNKDQTIKNAKILEEFVKYLDERASTKFFDKEERLSRLIKELSEARVYLDNFRMDRNVHVTATLPPECLTDLKQEFMPLMKGLAENVIEALADSNHMANSLDPRYTGSAQKSW